MHGSMGSIVNNHLAMYPGHVRGEKWPGIDGLRSFPEKTGNVYVWKSSVKPIHIRPTYFLSMKVAAVY